MPDNERPSVSYDNLTPDEQQAADKQMREEFEASRDPGIAAQERQADLREDPTWSGNWDRVGEPISEAEYATISQSEDDKRHWNPLVDALGSEAAASFLWAGEGEDIQSYRSKETNGFLNIDAQGNFYDDTAQQISREAALEHIGQFLPTAPAMVGALTTPEREAAIPQLPDSPDATKETNVAILFQHAKAWIDQNLPLDQLKNEMLGFLSHSNNLDGTIHAVERLVGVTLGSAKSVTEAVIDLARHHSGPEIPLDMNAHIESLIRNGDDPAATFRTVDQWVNPEKNQARTEEIRLSTAEAVARKSVSEGMQPESLVTALNLALPNSADPANSHTAVANRIFQSTTVEQPLHQGPSRADLATPIAPASPASSEITR